MGSTVNIIRLWLDMSWNCGLFLAWGFTCAQLLNGAIVIIRVGLFLGLLRWALATA